MYPKAQLIDLSVPLADDVLWSPWWARTRVKRQSHRFGLRVIRWLFGVRAGQLATGLGWANETLQLSTHGTTHVDAPWHYAPLCCGRPSRTIDEMPLDWFYGPGVVIDIRHVERRGAASAADLQQALDAMQYQLQPHDIVLMRTDNDDLLGTRKYFDHGPGVSAEATNWLIDQGIRLMGIDSWGWDAPLKEQAAEARRTGRKDVFWSAHFVGAHREYCHMERLANLRLLPSHGFMISAFPLRVVRGSAGPARVVAFVPQES